MIYLRKFDSHDDYENVSSDLVTPNVCYDGEHVHFSTDEEYEEPTSTTDIIE